jgi:hypothetical protein
MTAQALHHLKDFQQEQQPILQRFMLERDPTLTAEFVFFIIIFTLNYLNRVFSKILVLLELIFHQLPRLERTVNIKI